LATNGSTLVGGVESPYASFEHPIEQAKQTNEKKQVGVLVWQTTDRMDTTSKQASKQSSI
jgi:hypothetical protein